MFVNHNQICYIFTITSSTASSTLGHPNTDIGLKMKRLSERAVDEVVEKRGSRLKFR